MDATPYVLTFLPTMLLIGVGFALGYSALSVQATAGVSDHEQGLAAGLVQTSFQMGGAIVLAAVSAVVGEGTIGDYRTAIAIVLGVAVVSLRARADRRRAAAHRRGWLRPEAGDGAARWTPCCDGWDERGARARPRSARSRP